MLRLLRWGTLAALALLALAVALFFTAGGARVLLVAAGPRLPVSPPAGTSNGDLVYLRSAVALNERGAAPLQHERFNQIVSSGAPDSREEVALTASRALAAFNNAHTTVLDPAMRRFPLRFHWTADALIIVKARPEHASLLGQRVASIGGRSPEALLLRMPGLVGGGTPGWVRYRSEYFLTAPVALAFLGASVDGGNAEIRTIDESGQEYHSVIPADPEVLPGDAFWEFLNAFPGDAHFQTDSWATLLRSDQALPLYLQDSEKLFLVRELAESDAIYVRMNACIDDDNETVAQFTRRVMDLVARQRPRYLVVDFRYNRGGDFTSALELVRGLSRATPANGRLYLIVGPNTFSAGILAGSQFRRHLGDRLTLVGAEVGDQLRFRGEGHVVTLPSTGIEVYLSSAWDDVANDCAWFDDCWLPNKFLLRGVGTLAVDIPVANTWRTYADGRDLVLEAALADIAARR